MASGLNLETKLKKAKGHEREYRWLEAAKSYESALHSKSIPVSFVPETWQRIGFCYNEASRQAGDPQEFKKLRQLAVDAYKNAAKLFEKEETKNHGKSAQCNALAEFSRSWLIPTLSEKEKTLDECRAFGNKALEAFKKAGDDINYVKMCNNLLLCLFERISIASTQKEKQTIAQEGICRGNEAISILSNMPTGLQNKSELLLANSLASLHSWYAANINELHENREKLANKSLIYSEKAMELSNEIDNPYYTAISRWAAAWSSLYFTEKIESSMEYAKEMLQQGLTVNDNYVKGVASFILTHVVDWIAAKEANPEKKREYYARIIKYSEDAARFLQIVSQDYYIAETYLFYTESYTHLGREVEIEIEGKRALLEKAVGIGRKGLEHAAKSGYPDAFIPTLHALSKALHFYSHLLQRKGQKINLLEEALGYRKDYIRIVDSAFPSYTWNVGVGKNYAGLIEAELARLETDNDKKIALLANAVSDLKDAISYCTKWIRSRPVQFGGSTIAVVAEYENTFGEVLNELYLLTEDKEALIEAIEVYHSAAERFKGVNLPSRAAESYWKIARIHSRVDKHIEAANNYILAAKHYEIASKRIPQLKGFYGEHSLYMHAWNQIEQARHSHSIEAYEEARQKYERAAKLHESTSSWSYLALNYFAWSYMEKAESLSRKENPKLAKQNFRKAYEQFRKAKESFKQKIDENKSADEKEMAQKLFNGSDIRRKYCQARILMEEAKLLDRKGKYQQSSKNYEKAALNISEIVDKIDVEAERKELAYLAILCRAWEKMALAEETTSSEFYLEAAALFDQAKDASVTKKTSLWALGNSSFCKGLAAENKFQNTLERSFHSKANKYVKQAANYYKQAGFQYASEYAKATQRLFDAYTYMNSAEDEVDPEKKTKQYQMAENLLQISAGSFLKANQPEKTAQVKQILNTVREEKALASSLNEVMQAPRIASSTLSFVSPSPTSEVSVGLEQFNHANVQANLVTHIKQIRVGESFCLSIEFVNAGKEPALLTRVEDFIPKDFVVFEEPEIYRLEDTCLNMKGKQLAPLKLVEAKLVLQPSKKGVYQLRPKVHYLDELGQKKSIQLKTLEIKAEEVILADRLSTGTSELNSILLGGIPEGYAVALTGAPSNERKMIVNKFLQAGTGEGQVTFYVSSDLFGVRNLLEKPNFYFFLCNPKLKDQIPDLPNVYKLHGKTDVNNLGIALVKAYRNIDPNDKSPKRICIKILSDVLVNYGVKTTRKWISELITNLGSKGFTMLAVFDASMHPADQANAVLNLFDGEISLYEIVDEMKCRKSVRIKKLGNQDYIENPIYLTKQR